MKKTLILSFLLFVSTHLFASHLQGYDLTLQNTGIHTFKVVLKLYRANYSGNAALPLSVNFKTYKKSDNASANLDFTVNRVQLYLTSYNVNENCLTNDANSNLQVGVYEYIITASQASSLNNSLGYYFSASICCRNAGGTNIDGTDAYGILFTMDFPRLSAGSPTINNNSPRFKREPLLKYIVGKTYAIDWSATDVDGDSLVYKLTKPLDDGSSIKPFTEIDYKSGYGIGINLADGNPDFQINSSTGIITYKPTMAGNYIVAVKVEEYRAGVKIGEIRREMQFLTVINPEFAPIISSNFDGSNDIVDTIDFPVGYTKTYNLIFNGKDIGDSVSMHILPNFNAGENIFDHNTFNAEYGEVGNTLTGIDAMNISVKDIDSVKSEFKWNVSSFMGRSLPYTFSVIARDQTCPSSLTDTIHVKLYMNYKRCFVNDTMMYEQTGCDSVVLALNNSIQTFYSDTVIKDTVAQQLNCDLVKTYLIYVREGTDKPNIIGDTSISDTSSIYTYEAVYKNDVTQFEWSVSSNGTIVGGDGSAMIHVKWNAPGQEHLKLLVYNRDNCSDSVDVAVNVDHVVGLNQPKNNLWSIYPNPANEEILISGVNQDEFLDLIIFDIRGKQILKQKINKETKINLKEFNAGVYFIRLGNSVQRFVKL